jgi:hypothetical protein
MYAPTRVAALAVAFVVATPALGGGRATADVTEPTPPLATSTAPPPADAASPAFPPATGPADPPPRRPGPPAAGAPNADGTASVMVANPLPVEPPPPLAAPGRRPTPMVGMAPGLLAELLEPVPGPAASAAYARPLTLLETLRRAGDPARRLWIVQAYWKTAIAFATVRSCSETGRRLDLVAPGADPHDRAVLDVAAAAARADLAEAIAVLGTTQQELVDLVRLPAAEPPPWPIDRPLATSYQTHFETIFAQRIATGRVRAIARTLPARHEAVEARAQAVRAATEAVALAETDHAKGVRPIEAVMVAHAALMAQEREFLRAVRAYNIDIAEYGMAVADLTVPDDLFVAMLIGATGAPSPVVPAAFPGGPAAVAPLGTLP